MRLHHQFLYDLFKQTKTYKTKAIIKQATNNELKVLLKVLFCIERGHIPLKRKLFERIKVSRRLYVILGLRRIFRVLLKAPTREKRQWLTQLSSLYRYLLSPLFVE